MRQQRAAGTALTCGREGYRVCGGEKCRACDCVRGWLKENGGGFLLCIWATEGTPGSRRVAGGKNSLLGAKFRYCS